MKPFPAHPERVLVRSTNWIGDAVMTIPAVRAIRRNFPDAEITLLALPWVADIFRHSPWVDELLLYEKQGQHHGMRGRLRLVREMSVRGFDAAILLQNAFEAALVTSLARIPVRAGYTTDGRALLLTHGVRKPPGIGGRHQVYYYQEMLAGLGLDPGPDRLELYLAPGAVEQARQAVDAFRAEQKVRGPVIGFNPGASYGPAKRWPGRRFGELARLLAERCDCMILVFGTDADRQAARLIRESCPQPKRILDLTGRTDLALALAFIDRCDVFVTNDSGLMHVAAALDVPLVAIFGSTDHVATGPFSERAAIVRRPMACSPCMKTHCPQGHFRCMEAVTAGEVLAAMEPYLCMETVA